MKYAAMVIVDVDVVIEHAEVKDIPGIERVIEDKVLLTLAGGKGITVGTVRAKLLGKAEKFNEG